DTIEICSNTHYDSLLLNIRQGQTCDVSFLSTLLRKLRYKHVTVFVRTVEQEVTCVRILQTLEKCESVELVRTGNELEFDDPLIVGGDGLLFHLVSVSRATKLSLNSF
ncbi:hypothetical protein PFISCL1PPCAC_8851, partial [Pristionchus fissidentatus]